MSVAEAEPDVPVIVRVPHPDDMDAETFCKHVNARHAHSIPEGFTLLPDELDEYVAECWRLWHERMHRLPIYDGSSFRTPDDGGHTHKPARGKRGNPR